MSVNVQFDYSPFPGTATIDFELHPDLIGDVLEELGRLAGQSPYYSHLIKKELKDLEELGDQWGAKG